jgi:hypothetical protein
MQTAAGYVVEQALYLCISVMFMCICAYQMFIIWRRDPAKVRITQRLNIIPVFLLNIVIAIISVDVRCVYGIYTPSIVVGLTYVAFITAASPVPRWSFEISRVKADEMNIEIPSLGVFKHIIGTVTVVGTIYAIISCALVLKTRMMVYASSVLFVLFAIAASALLPLSRLYWIIRTTRVNMVKSGTMGDATAKKSYETKVLRNLTLAVSLTTSIFVFALVLCTDPYFTSLDIDTLLLAEDPAKYTASPVVTLLLFWDFQFLFCSLIWVGYQRVHLRATSKLLLHQKAKVLLTIEDCPASKSLQTERTEVNCVRTGAQQSFSRWSE